MGFIGGTCLVDRLVTLLVKIHFCSIFLAYKEQFLLFGSLAEKGVALLTANQQSSASCPS